MIEHENSAHTIGWPCESCERERVRKHLEDPEVVRDLMASLANARAGRVLPWRIAMLPLPRWVFGLLFRIAPWTWAARRGGCLLRTQRHK